MPSTIKGLDNFQTSAHNGLIQVVNTHLDLPFTQAGTANVKTLVTGLNATITPISVNSQILVLVQWCGEISGSEENEIMGLQRNGVDIGMPQDPGARNAGIMPISINYHNNDSSTMESCQFHFLDAPGSTDPQTYQAYHLCVNTSTLYTNRTLSATASAAYERGTSSITLLEILL